MAGGRRGRSVTAGLLAATAFCALPPPARGGGDGDPALVRAAAAVKDHTPLLVEGHGSAMLAIHLAALGARARGKETWTEFREEYYPRILAAREENGSIRCICRRSSPAVTCDSQPLPFPGAESFRNASRVYVTSVNLLILALDGVEPKSLPPIRVRPGTGTPR